MPLLKPMVSGVGTVHYLGPKDLFHKFSVELLKNSLTLNEMTELRPCYHDLLSKLR